jgi:mannose-6-phosphate isomerase-like protein (cupin superfamily)
MMSAPKFVGSHGNDWCVRPAQFGPPDHVNGTVMHWLIVPGPPISCYLAHSPAVEDPQEYTMYHRHPETWSLHVMLSGTGRHYAEGQENPFGPGSILYQGPGVRHSIVPDRNSHMTHISIQYPEVGWKENEWIPCPEAGTTDRFGDPQAFLERFGSLNQVIAKIRGSELFTSERWKQYVVNRRRKD